MTPPEADAGLSYEDLGIVLGRGSGPNIKCHCPKCHGERKNQADKSLSVDIEHGQWVCHHCRWSSGLVKEAQNLGIQRTRDAKMTPTTSTPPIVAPTPLKSTHKGISKPPTGIVPELVQWFEEQRGISRATLERMDIRGVEREGKYRIYFPYRRDGELVNIKFRTGEMPNPKVFTQIPEHERPVAKRLYNLDNCRDAGTIIIVEGEMDTCAIVEAGWLSVCSPQDGAPAEIRDQTTKEVVGVAEVGAKADGFLTDEAKEIFAQAKRIIIATDDDPGGRKLGDHLLKIFDPVKCWRINWSDYGVKDANELLIRDGKDALDQAIVRATPVPIPGIYTFADYRSKLKDAYYNGRDTGMVIGIEGIDKLYRPKFGQVTCVIGKGGNGKTSLMTHAFINLAHFHGMRFAVFSPEMGTPDMALQRFVECAVDKPIDGNERMTEEELDFGVDWVAEHFIPIDGAESGKTFGAVTLSELAHRTEQLILRSGINGLIVDPWNRMQSLRPEGMTTTEYASQAMDILSNLTHRHNMAVWLVVHPSKTEHRGERESMPSPEDAQDSANFAHKADVFIGVHRNKWTEPVNHTFFRVWKHREEGVSGELGECELIYNRQTRRFYGVHQSSKAEGVGRSPYPPALAMAMNGNGIYVPADVQYDDEAF